MTVDRFVEDRRARWARLENLISEANGRVERLAPSDVLELGRLYRSASSDLAVARRDFALDAATERLNDLVATAHALVYSEAPTSGRRLRRFFLHELPSSVRANSRFTAVSLAAFAIPLLATFAIGLLLPEIAATALPPETRQHLAERRLWTDIPEGYRPLVGPLIIVNNVRVAVAAFAGGLTAGALTLYLLVANGAFLGTVLAVVQGYGLSGGLLTFTAAHGPLEISCIVLSGGAGLRLAWALLRPGDRSRRDALRLAGAQAIRVMLLIIPALGVAGILEAFLSPSDAPIALKVTVGVVVGLALWSYIFLVGRPSRKSAS
ncbi:MAG: stage II sporulation protein M [Chloroflexi bacterium]|nr:MAG: stage II sporulation protein M [Chloroflexota bacterium]TME71067.1 MAG: stage II sporulation protein M [Chloroflexota bacterium]TMG53445.1 MAG: stage II sporulation protein M [Chloroflexota bacterium]